MAELPPEQRPDLSKMLRPKVDQNRTLMRLTPEARYTATEDQLQYDTLLRRCERVEALLSTREEELRRLRRVKEVAQLTVDNDAYPHVLKAALLECDLAERGESADV